MADRLTTVSHNGITYRMVGASGSAKNGKYYYCDIQHEPLIAKRFQQWPEAAITYFGILVSGCKVVHTESKATVMVVRDLVLGTNDCRGWIRESLFRSLRFRKGTSISSVWHSTRFRPKAVSKSCPMKLPMRLAPTSSFPTAHQAGHQYAGVIPKAYFSDLEFTSTNARSHWEFEKSQGRSSSNLATRFFSMRRRSRSKPRSYPRLSRRLRLSRPHGVKAIIARWL